MTSHPGRSAEGATPPRNLSGAQDRVDQATLELGTPGDRGGGVPNDPFEEPPLTDHASLSELDKSCVQPVAPVNLPHVFSAFPLLQITEALRGKY